MKTLGIPLISILLTTLLLDAVWLGTMIQRFYPAHIGHLLAPSPKLGVAALFYLIYSLGIYVFVVNPSLQNSTGYLHVFLLGFFFGLVAYGTYDLTNHATLRDWPYIVTVVDMLWGGFLTGTVSICSVAISTYFK
jgi:uncharacterized membrane protein